LDSLRQQEDSDDEDGEAFFAGGNFLECYECASLKIVNNFLILFLLFRLAYEWSASLGASEEGPKKEG